MIIQCSWCKIVMGEKPGPEGQVTHDVCRKCWKKNFPNIDPGPECEAEWTKLEKQGKANGK